MNSSGHAREAHRRSQELSLYALKVLTELGVAFDLLSVKDDKYSITKESRFLINDPMTRVNFDFAHDVCYAGLDELKDALLTSAGF